MSTSAPPLMEIRNLVIEYGSRSRPTRAVDGVDFVLGRGEIVGIAGESGSGKSTLCKAMIHALPGSARETGSVIFDGRDLNTLDAGALRRLRGREIAMIPQNPMTSLDPLFKIGDQIGEALRRDRSMPETRIGARAIELLRAMRLTAPEARVRQYPHELSGGMRQRVLIAMATAGNPKLLLADEPTTALDATVQEDILRLFVDIRDRTGASIVIVTHDLGVIRRACERVIIMYAGRVVEEGPVERVFDHPRHPYTRGLIASIPAIEGDSVTLSSIDGQPPDLAELGPGCAFAARCRDARDICATRPPESRTEPGRRVFCWNEAVGDG